MKFFKVADLSDYTIGMYGNGSKSYKTHYVTQYGLRKFEIYKDIEIEEITEEEYNKETFPSRGKIEAIIGKKVEGSGL